METNTCNRLLFFGSHPGPCHVPSNDKHTLPSRYKLGLKRTVPLPVVNKRTFGGTSGYFGGQYMSKANKPDSYGVPGGPLINARIKKGLFLSKRTKMAASRWSGKYNLKCFNSLAIFLVLVRFEDSSPFAWLK